MNTLYSKYGHLLLLSITTLLSTLQFSYSSDTINSTQIFRDDGSTLVSSSGHYELGYFSPDNSDNRYLAIWYKRVSPRTVVWVANRDNPVRGIPTGALRVVQPGILALQNRTGGIAWSTNTSRAVQNPVAKLLDSGNLVVKDANDDNPDNFLWQSFDYPTDTTLPGMKLGVNFRTGREVHITASKSNGNPASGDYTFHCDPTGYPQLVTRKGDVLQYSSGPWNGLTFSGSVNLRTNPFFTFGVVINKDEVYYHYDLLNESIYTRYTLSDAGVRQRLIWDYKKQSWTLYYAAPTDGCDIFNRCGPYGRCSTENTQKICGCLEKFKPIDPQGWDSGDWSKGCNRSTPLNCEKGDGFLKYSGVKLPNTRRSWYNTTMTLAECEVECSKNCSCTAYASLDISRGENGCLIWFDELIDIREMNPGQDIYIRLASSEIDSERKRKILIITLCVVFGMLILSLSILLYLYLKRKKKLNLQLEKTGKLKLTSNANHLRVSHNEEFELPQFSLSTIKEATDNFSTNNELGKGGFGPVYKGTLEDRREIAVKRLSGTSHQGVDQFKNEVLCIAKLQHRNLVKLLGWCSEGDEMMLVYEYLTNKSLDKILFDPTRSTVLDWPRRLNIINGIARGLLYLHQDSCLRVIHRDLKASNILLDSDMNAKISDFGFARTFGGNETEANTSQVVGTYGYMSPEYAMEGNFSFKSDVYSLGVLVLEVVSGKRNRGFTHMDQRLSLLGHAWTLYKEDKSVEVVDSCVRSSLHLSEIMRTIHIGLLCVQEQPDDRPTMSSVVFMLSNDVVLAEAKCPGFFTAREVHRTATSGSSRPRSSINTMTITQLEPR